MAFRPITCSEKIDNLLVLVYSRYVKTLEKTTVMFPTLSSLMYRKLKRKINTSQYLHSHRQLKKILQHNNNTVDIQNTNQQYNVDLHFILETQPLS